MEEKIPQNVINPFSEKFADEIWSMWKMHRWETDKFKYKGVISEQVALKHLVDLSEGDEDKAKKIVFQSIERQWSGFYPLRQTSHGTREKSNPDVKADLRSRVQAAVNKKFGGGEQKGSSDHLKAV